MKGFFSLTAKFLVGLFFTILILIFFFKLFSIYGALQEQQRAIASVQGLQTGINYVCTTKKPIVIEIDLPQNVFGGKGESLIDALARGIYQAFSGKEVETAKEMAAYTFSIENYGDPWYVLYYEFFPEGEDYGWRNWHRVAGTSVVEVGFFFSDIATCALPFAKTLASSVKQSERAAKLAKLLKLDAASEKLSAIKESVSESRISAMFKRVFSLKEKPGEQEIVLKEAYESAKKEGKLKVAYQTFREWFKSSLLKLKNEKEASLAVSSFRTIERESDEVVEIAKELRYLQDISPARGITPSSDMDELISSATKIRNLFEKNEKALEVVETTKDLVSKAEKANKDVIFQALYFGNNKLPLAKRYLLPEEAEILEKALHTLKNSPSDLTLYLTSKKIDKILLKLDSSFDSNARKLSEDIRNWIEFQEKVNRIKRARIYLDSPSIKPYLIGKVKWYTSLYRNADIGLIRAGKWHGYRFAVSTLLSPAEFSFLKFNPAYCGENSICLKNALSWEILKFPLTDCKQAGYNYIELEKLALEPVSFEASALSFFEGLFSNVYGNKPYSRFYLASPCQGKVLIIPGECEGNLKEVPIIARDVFGNVELEEKSFTCERSNYLRVSAMYSNGTVFFIKDLPPATVQKEINDPVYGTSKLENINIECDVTDQVLKIYGIDEKLVTGEENRTICSQSFDTSELSENHAKTGYLLPDSISCTISLPKILGKKHVINKTSNFKLFCSKWNLTENQTECDYSFQGDVCKRWCCLEWSIIDTSSGSSSRLFNVSKCEDYPKSIITDKRRWYDHLMDEYIPSGGVYSKKMAKILEKEKNEHDLILSPYCEPYPKCIPKKEEYRLLCKAACKISDTHLPEKLRQFILSHYNQTFPSTEDLSSYSLLDLINLNQSSTYLPVPDTFPCIKVFVIGKETKGFCYTPPRNTQEILENVVSTAGSVLSMVTSMLGPEAAPACIVGSLIQYGSSWLAKELKKNSLWPYNFMLHSFKENI